MSSADLYHQFFCLSEPTALNLLTQEFKYTSKGAPELAAVFRFKVKDRFTVIVTYYLG